MIPAVSSPHRAAAAACCCCAAAPAPGRSVQYGSGKAFPSVSSQCPDVQKKLHLGSQYFITSGGAPAELSRGLEASGKALGLLLHLLNERKYELWFNYI